MTSLSVIVPCYNEERYLPRLLDQLCKQTVAPRQVIIADSNSTDGTIACAMAYHDRLPIQVAQTTKRTPGAARNAGAALATSEYLLFIDADCVPASRRFIERLCRVLNASHPDYATPIFWSDGLHPFDHAFLASLNIAMLCSIIFSIGGTMCVRAGLHEKIGGFSEDMQSGEDTHYAKTLRKVRVTYKRVPWLFVNVSSRRGKHDGRLTALLQCTPTNNALGKRVHANLASRGKNKTYGKF